MSLQPYSVRAIARMLELDRETVANAIRRAGIEPYDRVGGSGRYLLEIVAKALLRRVGDVDPAMLPPGDRRHFFDAKLKELELDRRTGQLVSRDDVRTASARAFSLIANTCRAIPDRLERTLGIAPEVAEEIESVINAALNDLADQMEAVIREAEQLEAATKAGN